MAAPRRADDLYDHDEPPARQEDQMTNLDRDRYYFAARYSRNPELRVYRDELLAAIPGSVVTSSWIDCHPEIGGGLQQSFTPEALAADPESCWQFGQKDLEDLASATAIVSFTGNGGGGKGGRHIEHGIGIAYVDNGPWLTPTARFRLIVIGPRENVFHCHPATEVFPSWAEFLAAEHGRVLRGEDVQP